MLGKFIGLRRGGFIESTAQLCQFPDESLAAAARSVAGLSSVVRLSTPGSSGAFFSGFRDGRRRFLKTHRTPAAAENLQKEFVLLEHLYGDELAPSFHMAELDGCKQFFLEMAYVDNGCPDGFAPDSMKRVIADFTNRLSHVDMAKLNYSARQLHALVAPALAELSAAGLIEPDIVGICEDCAVRFGDYVDSEPPIICHGDLGNENIRRLNDREVVIDWEDSIVGFRNYDVLYWLTFLAQRSYYSASLLSDIGVHRQFGVDIMVVVVLLKTYLAFLNGRYNGFRFSVSERIREIVVGL